MFDKIYCIHYLPYEERLQDTIYELDRIGILNSPNFEWYNVPESIVYNKLYETLIDHKIIFNKPDGDSVYGNFRNKNVFNLAINKFNLLLKAQYHNYKNILILEDDNCYLKNLDQLSKYIESIPGDYDIVNMNYFFMNTIIDSNSTFVPCSQIYDKMFNFAFTALSSNGIDHIIRNQINFFKTSDFYINSYKTFMGEQLKSYVSNKNLCIQNYKYKITNNCYWYNKVDGYNDSVVWTYKKCNINILEYSVP